MVWRVVNVPTKKSNIKIECRPIEGGFQIYTSTGFEICTICSATEKGLAEDIADLLTKFRDIGFDHGRKHIRESLGIDV